MSMASAKGKKKKERERDERSKVTIAELLFSINLTIYGNNNYLCSKKKNFTLFITII